jgi:hypothetical protein
MAASDMTFRARRSARNSIVFLVAFGLMAAGGVWMYLSGYQSEGIAVSAFGLLAVFAIVATVLSPNSWYRIRPGVLQLHKGFAGRSIPLSSLRAARVVPATEVAAALREYVAPVVLAETSLDIRGWATAGKQYGQVVRYCSVPIVESRATSGTSRNVVRFDLKLTGEFVVLELDGGPPLLISPKEPGDFARKLRRQLPDLPQRSKAAALGSNAADGGLENAVRERRRRYWLMVGITSIPVAVGAVLLLWTNLISEPDRTIETEMVGSTKDVVAEPAEHEWATDDLYRASYETSTASIAFVDDAEQRRRILREKIDQSWRDDITAEIMGYFLSRSRGELKGERYSELRQRVLQEVSRGQPTLIRFSYDDDVTLVYVTVDIEDTDLKNRLTVLFSEYVELELADWNSEV